MKFSIIMPSYLGAYKNAAADRDKKIVRAIRSVENQIYEDWELIVVADGCNQTKKKVKEIWWYEPRIRGLLIPKQKIWSGRPRNAGIEKATGEYICYLDIDDVFGETHLSSIVNRLNGKTWYWFDDYVWDNKSQSFRLRKCNVHRMGMCGTSNIIHKKIAFWNIKPTYGHDWRFIRTLRAKSKNYEYIKAGRYCVCHIPGRCNV